MKTEIETEAKTKRTKFGVFGILERNGKVLLGLRDPSDRAFPNCWCHPGGGVEFQEPIDEALKREFLEEVLLAVQVSPGYMGVHEYIEDGRHVVLVFREVKSDSSPIAGDGFVRLGWFSLDEIRSLSEEGETTPLTIVAAEAWQNHKSSAKQLDAFKAGMTEAAEICKHASGATHLFESDRFAINNTRQQILSARDKKTSL